MEFCILMCGSVIESSLWFELAARQGHAVALRVLLAPFDATASRLHHNDTRFMSLTNTFANADLHRSA